MKKQINPTIKAHLVRGAFYLLLLLAVCAIPLTLAQRNTTKRSVATAPKASGITLSRLLKSRTATSGPLRGQAVTQAKNQLRRGPAFVATPGGCQFHVLIVYSDNGLPSQLQSEILAEPNVVTVDLFDGQVGTPTLAQLQQYRLLCPTVTSRLPTRSRLVTTWPITSMEAGSWYSMDLPSRIPHMGFSAAG